MAQTHKAARVDSVLTLWATRVDIPLASNWGYHIDMWVLVG